MKELLESKAGVRMSKRFLNLDPHYGAQEWCSDIHKMSQFLASFAAIGIASFPGTEEGEEKERLVHTVCVCAQL